MEKRNAKHSLSRYFKAAGLYTVGNIVNRCIALIMLPIITRMMSTADYGIASTYFSYESIVAVLIGLSLENTMRPAMKDLSDELDDYFASLYGLDLITTAVGFAVVLLLYSFSPNTSSRFLVLGILCVFQASMAFPVNTMAVRYMMEEQYVKRFLLQILPNFLVAVLSVSLLTVLKTDRYLGRILPYVVSAALFGSWFIVTRILHAKRKVFNPSFWKYGLSISVPLIFHSLSITVLTSSDVVMIQRMRSPSEAGIYSVMYNAGMVAGVISSALGSVWSPWVTRKLQNNDRGTVNQYSGFYLTVPAGVTFCLMMAAPEGIKLLADRSYWEGISFLPPIILAQFVIFMYSLPVDIEYYYARTKVMPVATIAAALSNLALNALLIPKYGAFAAGCTTFISYLICFLIHFFFMRKLDGKIYPIRVFIKPFLFALSSAVVFYLLKDNWIARWLIAASVFIGVFLLYKKKFQELK